MKGWESQWTNFTSNTKYGDMLHLYASKQFVHLQNYILSHTNRCAVLAGGTKIGINMINQDMDVHIMCVDFVIDSAG